MTPSYLQVHINAAARGRALLSEDFLNEYGATDVFDRILMPLDKRPILNAHPVNKSLYLWSKTTFPSYMLNVLGDRMEMAHSVEARLPFLDHDLVDLAQTLPVEHKINDLMEKWVLRQSVKDKVTKQVLQTHKHPFTAPPATLNPEGRLFQYVNDTLSSSDAMSLPYFEMKRVVGMLSQIDKVPMEERGNLDAVVSMLTSVVELKRLFSL